MEYEKPSLFQRIFCNKKMLSVHINNFISRYNIFSFASQSVLSKDQKSIITWNLLEMQIMGLWNIYP